MKTILNLLGVILLICALVLGIVTVSKTQSGWLFTMYRQEMSHEPLALIPATPFGATETMSMAEWLQDARVTADNTLMLVNPQNPLPEGYVADIKEYNGAKMHPSMIEPYIALRDTVQKKTGIRIYVSADFRTAKEQQQTLRRLARGDIDIIVGTHRLIGSDIKFKDLGLLIVDEEQRFGVAQKEKLKQLGGNVDVLTLSATPIPRTLNMAMGGIRDISLLDEAPDDRLPVQTYVLEYDDLIIFEAIRRELRRGGQVFYIHNFVESIDNVAAHIAKEIPEARVTVAHGKMDKDELEDIWSRMLAGEIDVLVSTTIIETGIDIPNANTLIADRADRLGLSQLHQLRGRVGRSSRRAYAYFTYPKNKGLSEIAQKRLEAIKEYAEFGAGFRIALRDMEIRGAGNILGAEQHGHLEAIGYDLYIKLLNDAVLEEKGGKPTEREDCTVSFEHDAFIPEGYVHYPGQRMTLYKRIALIRNQYDADDIADELLDRFGELPESVENLLKVALIRSQASELGIRKVTEMGGEVRFIQPELNIPMWQEMSFIMGGRVRVTMGSVGESFVSLRLKSGENSLAIINKMFEKYLETVQNEDKNSEQL